MAGNRMICTCKEVDYLTIRMAMVKQTARTVEEIQEITGAGTECGGCIQEIEKILASGCGCSGTSLEDVVAAVRDGADSAEKVGAATGAGKECGRCQILINNVIEHKR